MAKTPSFTPSQLIAARALAGWTQADLAARADVAVSTIADFERGARSLMTNNMASIITVVEEAGFLFRGGGVIAISKALFEVNLSTLETWAKTARYAKHTTFVFLDDELGVMVRVTDGHRRVQNIVAFRELIGVPIDPVVHTIHRLNVELQRDIERGDSAHG